jgi:hypothetical protein
MMRLSPEHDWGLGVTIGGVVAEISAETARMSRRPG